MPSGRKWSENGGEAPCSCILARASFTSCDLCSHMAPHDEKDPALSLMLCCRCFKICNNFCKRGPTFNFAVCSIHGGWAKITLKNGAFCNGRKHPHFLLCKHLCLRLLESDDKNVTDVPMGTPSLFLNVYWSFKKKTLSHPNKLN